jgi:hypothetical protein
VEPRLVPPGIPPPRRPLEEYEAAQFVESRKLTEPTPDYAGISSWLHDCTRKGPRLGFPLSLGMVEPRGEELTGLKPREPIVPKPNSWAERGDRARR